MPIHDSYARVTPYELLLPDEGFAEQRFPLVRREAEERQADLSDPDRFVLLSQVGAILRAIRGEEDDPRLIQHFGALVFHAFHFWNEGMPFFFLETPVVRYLVDSGLEPGSWAPSLPAKAGYLQLPQHLFWVPGGEEPPESVDGLFWSVPDGENLSTLIAMGVRKDRPGLSVVPLPQIPLLAAGEWATLRVRSTGEDFRSSLPGAELENLYSLEAGAEAVKLAMRVFWYLDVVPGSVAEGTSALEEPDGPEPSKLDSRRIVSGEV